LAPLKSWSHLPHSLVLRAFGAHALNKLQFLAKISKTVRAILTEKVLFDLFYQNVKHIPKRKKSARAGLRKSTCKICIREHQKATTSQNHRLELSRDLPESGFLQLQEDVCL
jgi:hypothetical protein